jgi:hypothetical protein
MTNQKTITIAAAIFVAVLATVSTQSMAFAVHAGPPPTPKYVSLHDQLAIHVWSSLCSQLGFLVHGNSHCRV